MSRCNTCPNREGNKCVVFDAPVCDKTLITCLEYDLYNWNETLIKYKRTFEILKNVSIIVIDKNFIQINTNAIWRNDGSGAYELLEELMKSED